LLLFIVCFFYQRYLLEFVAGSNLLNYIVYSLGLIIFILTIYRVKIGLYLFIFLLPLLNSFPKIIKVENISIILLLFFSLGLGFIVAIFKNNFTDNQFIDKSNKLFYLSVYRAILFLTITIVISSFFVVYRLTNFYPFITNAYYDLFVNVNKTGSTKSIFLALQLFFNYIIGFALFFIIINSIKNLKEVTTTVIILLSSTVIATFIGLYQYFFDPYFGNIKFWVEMNRINATFTDPNSLGAYSVMLFPIFLSLIFVCKKWFAKLIIGILLIPFLLNIFFSGSRTAFLGILVTSAIFIIIGLWIGIEKLNLKFKKPAIYKKALMWLSVVIILIILMLSVLNLLPVLFEKTTPSNVLLQRMSLAAEKLNTAIKNKDWAAVAMVSEDRKILWDQAVNMFKDHPVSGIGAGAYTIELPNYYVKTGVADYRKTLVDFSGNYYLQFLSELGLPGLILILTIFFIIIKKISGTLRLQKKEGASKGRNWLIIGLSVSFISMIIALIFGPHTNVDEIQLTFWLIIGLLLASIMITKDKEKIVDIADVSRIKFNLTDRFALIVLIIIFAVSSASGSFTDLSINIKQNLYNYMNRYGYYSPKEGSIGENNAVQYRWLTTISSDIVEKKGNTMFFWIKAGPPDVKRDDIYIRFYIDNLIVKVVRLQDRDWHYIELKVPGSQRDKIAFTVCVSNALVPGNWNVPKGSKDPGIMITDREFKNN
jgi:O-antigen ligase